MSQPALLTSYKAMENNLIYIRRETDAFPRRLLHMADPPGELHVIGSLPADDQPSVAIVGSRMCSPYGRRIAYQFGMELAARGVQIVSGMALGIDGYAHEGALAANGRTFAVLGCGADICYPEKNRKLYREIPKTGGILSEELPGTPPLPYNFPKRNRIISALSDLVIVVEARKKSGSLITADSALEQGRTVMAVPGRVGDALAEGTNHLIAQGAEIAWSVQAILDTLLPLHESQKNKNRRSVWPSGASGEQLAFALGADISADPEESASDDPQAPLLGSGLLGGALKNGTLTPLAADICRILETDSRSFDELAEALSANASSLSSALLELRLAGFIEEHAGCYDLSARLAAGISAKKEPAQRGGARRETDCSGS